MARSKERQTPQPTADPGPKDRRFGRYCLVLLLAGVVVLVWLALLTFSPTDPPSNYQYFVHPPKASVDNAVGWVGARLAYNLRYWLGAGAYVGLLLLTVAAVRMLFGARIRDVPWRILGAALLITVTSAAFSMSRTEVGQDIAEGSAGILGLGMGKFILSRFSRPGSWVILSIALCIGVMLAADELVLGALRLVRRGLARRKGFRTGQTPLPGRAGTRLAATRSGPSVSPPVRAGRESEEGRGSPVGTEGDAPSRLRPLPLPLPPHDRTAPVRLTPAKAAGGPRARPGGARTGLTVDGGKDEYELPSMDLLRPPARGYGEVAEVQAAQRKLVLQQTLDDFNVQARVEGYETGPVITLFELSLDPGVKVSQIATLATDIARALAVSGVRIVPPRFGKDTIGIEVPNLDKEIVRVRELMELAPQSHQTMHLPLYLGKDAGGDPIVADLAGMPHMLIAGTTGSGKSVCINAIIVAMMMLRKPSDVRLILVDPKMVEMAAFEDIPHLLCPIVNDMRKAEEILEWAATKMDERYELLKEANVKNIAGYNRLGAKEIHKRFGVTDEAEKSHIPAHLPYYVIIIDELADLVMTADKEVESHIIRIAQKARAVGIHLILATQRPSVNVVTGLIKSNMPCRISFRVASRQESRIILDQNGAEVLLGRGDMLFLQPGSSTLARAQGTYVDDAEIRNVVAVLRAHAKPEYDSELMSLNARPSGDGSGEKDDLFDKAIEIVLATRRGSVSLLQRRLQVGYTRASRIIDQMAEAGILGDYKGSQARECLMTIEDWQQLQEAIAADQSGASAADGEPTSV
ncbi:MAG TPA: DNA translocase FtsK 4TM domain-containing protein [Phycisphaerae bacterium]|nr:DNA translocase FtsK 4TM domain-containing protein [Phycisphaerae bacterium]